MKKSGGRDLSKARRGDGWNYTLSYLGRFFDESAILAPDELNARAPEAAHAVYLTQVRQLGLAVGSGPFETT